MSPAKKIEAAKSPLTPKKQALKFIGEIGRTLEPKFHHLFRNLCTNTSDACRPFTDSPISVVPESIRERIADLGDERGRGRRMPHVEFLIGIIVIREEG